MGSPLSTNCASGVVGSVTPRLWTPPLRDLSEPGASVGPLQSEFARNVLRTPFRPWQDWLLLHAGELLPSGAPRFWLVIVLVARQNGKTHVPVCLAPYWSLIDEVPMILGTSTKIEYAKEAWLTSIRLMERAAKNFGDPLYGIIPSNRKKWLRQTNGECMWNIGDQSSPNQYKIAAANDEGGRSLTVHRLILDELRQHRNRAAWGASVPATEAVPDAQVWALSNAGTDKSTVLNSERAAALHFIETGEGDPGVGIFEWSAPDGMSPVSPDTLALANPEFGRSMNPTRLLGKAKSAVETGGETLNSFLTESLCIRVVLDDPAIDPGSWQRCLSVGSLKGVHPIATCVDVSPDGQHVALYAAAQVDGKIRIDPVAAWSGTDAVASAEVAIPKHLLKVRPAVLGWLPNGPGAILAARLRTRRKGTWTIPGMRIEEIKAEVPAVCMAFEKLVVSGQIVHSNDPLLNQNVNIAEKLHTQDVWRYSRKGTSGHVDTLYAASGAVHLARTMADSIGKPRVLRSVGRPPGRG